MACSSLDVSPSFRERACCHLDFARHGFRVLPSTCIVQHVAHAFGKGTHAAWPPPQRLQMACCLASPMARAGPVCPAKREHATYGEGTQPRADNIRCTLRQLFSSADPYCHPGCRKVPVVNCLLCASHCLHHDDDLWCMVTLPNSRHRQPGTTLQWAHLQMSPLHISADRASNLRSVHACTANQAT
jgi:hypothetical protein